MTKGLCCVIPRTGVHAGSQGQACIAWCLLRSYELKKALGRTKEGASPKYANYFVVTSLASATLLGQDGSSTFRDGSSTFMLMVKNTLSIFSEVLNGLPVHLITWSTCDYLQMTSKSHKIQRYRMCILNYFHYSMCLYSYSFIVITKFTTKDWISNNFIIKICCHSWCYFQALGLKHFFLIVLVLEALNLLLEPMHVCTDVHVLVRLYCSVTFVHH